MIQISPILGLSLHCIHYNNRLVAACQNGLILEASSNPLEKSALWTVTCCSSLWVLTNQGVSIRVTFDTTSKLVRSSQESGSRFSECLEVKDGDRCLLLRLSPDTLAASRDNILRLELFTENDPSSQGSTLLFVREGFNQALREINPDFFCCHPATTKTSTELLENIYDYVVIGSSFCSLAFIHQISQNDPTAKILVLEKGLMYLPEHHQQCPQSSNPGDVEFRPWTISEETVQNEFVQNLHGQIPLLGGRSTYWSGWSPTPSSKELAGWPEQLITALEATYFALARQFLNVIAANKINAKKKNCFLYRTFQDSLKNCFDSAASIESIEQVLHAPLAMGNDRSIKFSTAKMILSMDNVTVIQQCTVERISHDGKRATTLTTSQGIISLPNNSKLILAMSTLPATTLVLNSFDNSEFPQLSQVGKRFTAHFVSSVIARVPRHSLPHAEHAPDVELGAVYIAGMKDEAQYHLQISGVAYSQCQDVSVIHEVCKNYAANSIPRECIDASQDFVVVSCSSLGELDYKNTRNQFNLTNNGQCLTTNGQLTLCLNDQDKELWDLKDSITLKVLNKLSPRAHSDDLQYWHESDKSWRKDTPPLEQIRNKLLVHDASTMWIGISEDTGAPVGLDYRLQGVDNVYITGGALWPTGGSWNPVLTIVAMAMHLADTIHESARYKAGQPPTYNPS